LGQVGLPRRQQKLARISHLEYLTRHFIRIEIAPGKLHIHLDPRLVINLIPVESIPSGPALQPANPWTAPLNFSGTLSHDYSSSNIAVNGGFHDNSAAEYAEITQHVEHVSRESLFDAISNGDKDEVTRLLSTGTSVHVRDGINNAPLHTAILLGNIDIVESLLNYGADFDAIGCKGKTPLHLAIASRPLVELLLKHSPKLSVQDDEGNTALHYLLNTKNWWANSNTAAITKSILSSGADVNIKNKLGDSPLHRVVSDAIPNDNDYMELVSVFLDYTPDVTSPMRNGQTLLSMFLNKSEIFLFTGPAHYYYHYDVGPRKGYECLEKFLVAGADPNTIIRSKPLIIEYLSNGVYEENCQTEKTLLQLIQRANIDVVGPAGNDLFHLTLTRAKNHRKRTLVLGVFAIIDALISRNASPNQTNDEGATPLEIWLRKDSKPPSKFVKVALLLIEAVADTMIQTSTGGTLFDMLSWLPNEDQNLLTRALLKQGAAAQEHATGAPARSEWAELWRAAWKRTDWQGAKARMIELQNLPSRPKSSGFMECAFRVIAEHQLEHHKGCLKHWQENLVGKWAVTTDYEDYCTILRDCRERGIEIDISWYSFLLDLMDFT
jgi:ankyrin repeat protein